MLYKVKTTSGYGFLIRGVVAAKLTVSTAKFVAKLYNGKKITLNGATEFEIVADESPWMNSFEMIPPTEEKADVTEEKAEGYEFPREAEVPRELAVTTFAPLEELVGERHRSFQRDVIEAVRAGQKMGYLN